MYLCEPVCGFVCLSEVLVEARRGHQIASLALRGGCEPSNVGLEDELRKTFSALNH